MPSKDSNSQTWTLRFKQHKTTILLFVEQEQSFTSIKQDLLDAISKTGRTSLNDHALPSNPDDVIFGLLVDKNDPSKGWVGLEIPEVELEDAAGGKRKIGGRKGVLNASPLGAGLKDGAILAFKFRDEGAKIDKDDLDMDDENWDVIMPSYEDEYASQEKTS